jgi:Domain of Unknown Function (DUF1080)
MKTILLSLVAASVALAADPPKAPGKPYQVTAITREQVDADFAIQGEYTGKLGGAKAGVQVVAMGAGKFDLVLYRGGLPGDGWSGKKAETDRGNAETADGKIKITLAGQTGELAGGKLKLGDDTLERVERKSPTEGAVCPAGGVQLFDGTNTDAWEGAGMDANKLLKEGQNTKQKFRDYTIHLEFLLPYMPAARGQGRGNSGFYNQSRHEVQMLDSFGLEGKDNECGGIYTIKAPDLNMCYPPLQWQTYDIEFTAAKFDAAGKKTASARTTVKHNGVIIHKDIELPKATTAAPLGEGPEPGPLHLQNHGNPVRYRNIWIVEKK